LISICIYIFIHIYEYIYICICIYILKYIYIYIGSCGGPLKCALIKEKYGFDHAIDYKSIKDKAGMVAALKEVSVIMHALPGTSLCVLRTHIESRFL
jgi:hypothetical protein